MISNLESTQRVVQEYMENAITGDEINAGMVMVNLLAGASEVNAELKRLREENASLKRKMGFISQRERGRLHALVDVFTLERRDDD